MTEWYAKAKETFPDIVEAEWNPWNTPMMLWTELSMEFERAYSEPRNEDLIRRIYGFAEWCLEQGERSDDAGQDLPTCVIVAFYEHIPTCPAARADMSRWFTRSEVGGMEQAFSYHLKEGEFEQILALFGEPKSQRKIKREARKQKPAYAKTMPK